MHIPEQLFSSPLLKDLATQRCEIVLRNVQRTGNLDVDLSIDLYQVPQDRVAVVTGWGTTLTPNGSGAVILSTGLYAIPRDEPNTTRYYLDSGQARGNTLGTFHISGNGAAGIWCPPGSMIGVAQTIQPAAANIANAFAFYISLLTFPRGNVTVG